MVLRNLELQSLLYGARGEAVTKDQPVMLLSGVFMRVVRNSGQ